MAGVRSINLNNYDVREMLVDVLRPRIAFALTATRTGLRAQCGGAGTYMISPTLSFEAMLVEESASAGQG